LAEKAYIIKHKKLTSFEIKNRKLNKREENWVVKTFKKGMEMKLKA
jgi:hypothetical protein